MKNHIQTLLTTAIAQLQKENKIPAQLYFAPCVDAAKDQQHGDFATNIAMVLSKVAKKKPLELAGMILSALPTSEKILKAEIAGPGFINFFLAPYALHGVIEEILEKKSKFGYKEVEKKQTLLLEFVSANPTGPLHVGHGRYAAFGAALANILNASGFSVSCEYYVNDAGRQMDILAASFWIRYQNLQGNSQLPFPANGYQGDYVTQMAHAFYKREKDTFFIAQEQILAHLPQDEPTGGDKEKYIDALIEQIKQWLGADKYRIFFDFCLNYMLQDIEEDLKAFGVHFDNWFSERELIEKGEVEYLLNNLEKMGHLYEQDGAVWFRSTHFGDEKDRVLVRGNGQYTYFANDAAYHLEKFRRGFDQVVDIVGADHHGYFPRIKAVLKASQIDTQRFIVLLGQFVTLYRGEQQVQMSTRSGNFITLRELRQEIGNDAARFFYVMRKADQPMDFDLELAKKQSNENPVYYIYYAYARISSVLQQLKERNIAYEKSNGLSNINLLTADHERHLIGLLAHYPDVLAEAAKYYEPSILTHYLRDLASSFHAYYNGYQFLVDEEALRDARLVLITATSQVLANGLALLGIKPPDRM